METPTKSTQPGPFPVVMQRTAQKQEEEEKVEEVEEKEEHPPVEEFSKPPPPINEFKVKAIEANHKRELSDGDAFYIAAVMFACFTSALSFGGVWTSLFLVTGNIVVPGRDFNASFIEDGFGSVLLPGFGEMGNLPMLRTSVAFGYLFLLLSHGITFFSIVSLRQTPVERLERYSSYRLIATQVLAFVFLIIQISTFVNVSFNGIPIQAPQIFIFRRIMPIVPITIFCAIVSLFVQIGCQLTAQVSYDDPNYQPPFLQVTSPKPWLMTGLTITCLFAQLNLSFAVGSMFYVVPLGVRGTIYENVYPSPLDGNSIMITAWVFTLLYFIFSIITAVMSVVAIIPTDIPVATSGLCVLVFSFLSLACSMIGFACQVVTNINGIVVGATAMILGGLIVSTLLFIAIVFSMCRMDWRKDFELCAPCKPLTMTTTAAASIEEKESKKPSLPTMLEGKEDVEPAAVAIV